jgi:lactate dehydrogenase-like 2-hydroxyacid dehydrogenase
MCKNAYVVEAKPTLLLVGPARPLVIQALESVFDVHLQLQGVDTGTPSTPLFDQVQAIAVLDSSQKIDANFLRQFAKLEIVSIVGVGYDHVDARWAGEHDIMVTNTPDVLDEEVADTALGLLLCTVRRLPQAMRYLQDGKWLQAPFPLSESTLWGRTVGLVGMGRIGQVIARRLEAFAVAVIYHSRQPNAAVTYKYYPRLIDMARDADVLLVIVPGGSATRNLINAEVLEALGRGGVLINVARGSVVDEAALIAALREKKIMSAGLDVFANEPFVPSELLGMENVVLLPHVGSASIYTRAAMDELLVNNLLSWASGAGPLTPVDETPTLI